MIYAITDIETTGGFASANSITEVAVIRTDGQHELDRWSSLVRPAHAIPDHIAALTGIDQAMVEHAPVFAEIAEELFAMLEDAVFVAHNVHFDFSFLKKHFALAGLNWSPRKLCTVRLARKILPGLPSYSLGRLCDSLDILHENRHRAMGDTSATYDLFRLLVQRDTSAAIADALRRGSEEAFLPNHVNADAFKNLPDLPGVYYFTDAKGQLLYIGKARDLKKRVRSHFNGTHSNQRKQQFIREIHDISYRLTGTELIALLLEDAEIRKHWPKYNRAQKSRASAFGVYAYYDGAGYLRLGIQKHTGSGRPLRTFHALSKAREWLTALAEENSIHPHWFNLPHFDAAVSTEKESHNDKLHEVLVKKSQTLGTVLIKGEGRNLEEQSIVLIKDGVLRGFAFIDQDEGIQDLEELHDRLELLPSSETTEGILLAFLDKAQLSDLVLIQRESMA